MLRKKHSEISIRVSPRALSPFRAQPSSSPFSRAPDPKNLSPIRNRSRTPKSQPQPRSFLPNQPRRMPSNNQNTFQGELNSLASYYQSNYDSKRRVVDTHFGYNHDGGYQESSFSNLSNFSKDYPTDRGIKESKRLFTKCISNMNSDKKKASEFSSRFEPFDGDSSTSSKPPKIQMITMIESVVPEEKPSGDKRMPFQEMARKASESKKQAAQVFLKGEAENGAQMRQTSSKKEQIIELINQSFSMVGGSPEEEGVRVFTVEDLDQKARLLQSIYEEGGSDFGEFDHLMKKIQIGGGAPRSAEQSVQMSTESTKGGLTMDPFM